MMYWRKNRGDNWRYDAPTEGEKEQRGVMMHWRRETGDNWRYDVLTEGEKRHVDDDRGDALKFRIDRKSLKLRVETKFLKLRVETNSRAEARRVFLFFFAEDLKNFLNAIRKYQLKRERERKGENREREKKRELNAIKGFLGNSRNQKLLKNGKPGTWKIIEGRNTDTWLTWGQSDKRMNRGEI